jgi:hypothetical protein
MQNEAASYQQLASINENNFADQACGAIFARLISKDKRPVRLRARTPPFHGGDTSSNLVRATKLH